MRIEKKENEKTVMLLPEGNLVYEGITELESFLRRLRDEDRYIIIDFTYIKYLSAKAISIIVNNAKIFQAKRRDLMLVHVNENIMKLFDVIGVSKIISIFENEETVLSSVGPQVGRLEKNLLWSKDCIILRS
ncbi:MAG: STAS domain-containing protein [Candidatus Brocadiaceae bacterium]|nr:STAS domain-containing protein [Candidatus Brocadiaceae bacterium]